MTAVTLHPPGAFLYSLHHLGLDCHVPAKAIWIIALLCLALGLQAQPRQVDLYLPDAPPLTLVQDAKGHGIVGDATLLALKRAGYRVRIRVEPWARAQKTVMDGRDLLIIPLSRTPEREALYTWVAPVMALDRVFFSLDEPVKSFEEARQRYRQIGVGLGTAQSDILHREGFADEQIRHLVLGDKPAQLLLMGRIDAWFTGVTEGLYIWPQVTDRKLHMSPPLATTDLYIACSRQCDPQLTDAVAHAMQALRDEGRVQRIQKHYLPGGQ